MRKLLIVGLIAFAVTVVPLAVAENPHFISGPTCQQTSSTLVTCSGKIAGLGSAPLFIVVNATAGCTTQSGSNDPPGQSSFVSGPFNPSNGQFTFGPGTGNNVTATAGNCPGTQTGFVSAQGVTISVYTCTSGQPTFSRKTGAQTNSNCTLVLGPVAAG
jgi:hypothetical protein